MRGGRLGGGKYLLTGRFLKVQRDFKAGLVSRVAPRPELEQEARSMAADMLRATPLGPPLKQGMGLALDAASRDAVVAMEDPNQVLCTQGEDFAQGVGEFLEKRAPRYGEK